MVKLIDAPSPRGTNFDGLKVPASWFLKPGLALDAAPNIRNWKLGRDQDPRSHPYDKLASGEVTGGAADNAGLLKKIEAGDALDETDLAALRKALGAEGTDESGSNWKSGPLGPTDEPPAVKDNTEEMREALRAKGFSEDDIGRVLPMGPPNHDLPGKDQIPANATRGGVAGDINQVLRDAGRRFQPRRGDGFSVSAYSEPPTAALGMDAAAENELHRMFPGIEKIGHV